MRLLATEGTPVILPVERLGTAVYLDRFRKFGASARVGASVLPLHTFVFPLGPDIFRLPARPPVVRGGEGRKEAGTLSSIVFVVLQLDL